MERVPEHSLSDAPKDVAGDNLCTPAIKEHSLEKIHVHNRIARMFATAMRSKWDNLAYIGLYSGSGHARLANGKTVETSALGVLRQPDLFSHYVYVDADADCTAALEQRIRAIDPPAKWTVLTGNVNDSVKAVRNALPRFGPGNTLLSFCFVDPFDIRIRFRTLHGLSDLQLDFLILLMTGNDARRNFEAYYNDEDDTRIAELLDDRDWRTEYRTQHTRNVVQFIIRKFDQRMQRERYLPALNSTHPVKVAGKGVHLYDLAYYSKHPLGKHFWKAACRSLTPQQELFG